MQDAAPLWLPKNVMCTIAFLIDVVDGARLVVGANRDELFARPARVPEVLIASPHVVVGGVDELSGGTWLAVRRDGRFAAVTNQRALAPATPGLRSRGHAVKELAAAADPEAYIAALDPTQYASMNLAWGDSRGAAIAYVRRETPTVEIERLGRGIHILANDRVGAAGFPRAERLAAALAASALRWPEVAATLVVHLGDHTRVAPPPSHLPAEIARELTATCIHAPHYGTRCSTILAANDAGMIAYRHADGPPCVTPYVDRLELL
jgi:uncharacterized protein with NRDE domain